ncbi:MAG: hypothetical protein QOH33_2559 [Paraburkholderia sp.]|nr:hypothetical protein [Paraburkholderia sp.]
MNQAELLKYAGQESWDDYRKHYLIRYYKEKSDHRSAHWRDCFTNVFLNRHSVEGTLTQQAALDVCRRRSLRGTQDFESTLVDAGLLQKIVAEVSERFIAGHQPEYRLCDLRSAGMLIHVSCTAGVGFLLRQAVGSFKVGIDENGLICHLEATEYRDLRQ